MNKILIIILAGTLCASGFGCVTSGHITNRDRRTTLRPGQELNVNPIYSSPRRFNNRSNW